MNSADGGDFPRQRDIVEPLVRESADVNVTSSHDRTRLSLAIALQDKDITKFLLKNEVNPRLWLLSLRIQ